MAKKKKITENQIIDAYMEFVLTHGEAPKSIFQFAKENNFEESDFYQYFGSFEALEETIFYVFGDNTMTVLMKSEDYEKFDARNKLLSYYFTFLENLTANRSYVVYALNKDKHHLKNLRVLKKLRQSFLEYIQTLNIETIDFKSDKIEKAKSKIISESAWIQLLVTIKFWLDDTSKGFEKTDIFIEKSVNTSFDLINTTPLKSILDLGKFLYKEKMHMN